MIGRRRWLVLGVAGFVLGLCVVLGRDLPGRLSAGGYEDPGVESARAERLLERRFGMGVPQLQLVARAGRPITDPAVARAGRELSAGLAAAPGVGYALSPWTTNDPRLVSYDRRAGLIHVHLTGDDRQVSRHYDALIRRFGGRQGPFTISATGKMAIIHYSEREAWRDLVRAELVALPLVGLILLWAFRSLVAALIPLVVGGLCFAATTAALSLLARVTPVSVFALNVTTALGFGLAVDYSLIMVSRFREELGGGRNRADALRVTLATAGRTVAFSAAAVAVPLGTLAFFPLYFLSTIGWAAVAVVVFAAVSALVVVPALLSVLGGRVDRGRLPRLGHRARRDTGEHWARLAGWVQHKPGMVLVACAVVVMLLAAPFLGVRFGRIDERWLPGSAQPRLTAEQVYRQFPLAGRATMLVVLPRTPQGSATAIAYSRKLSLEPRVQAVGGPGGVYVHGLLVPDFGRYGHGDAAGAWFAVVTALDPWEDAAKALVRQIRADPAGGTVLVGGLTAALIDLNGQLGRLMTIAGAVMALAVVIVLFAFTGSVLIPLKALVMNMLGLAAGFGALVWVFQEGHLAGILDASVTGRIDPMLPVLMFCLAFGVGMDYELWLVSRIAEAYRATGDNDGSVIAGLRGAGRLITASAAILIVVTGALATADLTVIKMLGFVFAVSLIVDVTLVRGLLLPAAMTIAGRWNWWAPAWLARARPNPAWHGQVPDARGYAGRR